ncbi:hypothetical protein EI94DRAFT_908459 [Lactarius quietus]|nr:hypothetical protein EI94DRAFT_908459 [Lactarius quietus]
MYFNPTVERKSVTFSRHFPSPRPLRPNPSLRHCVLCTLYSFTPPEMPHGKFKQSATGLLDDTVPLNSSLGTNVTPSPTHGLFEGLEISMAHVHGDRQNHAAAINLLPDDIFLEIFAYCTRCWYWEVTQNMRTWQVLVHVCQRWRQIIYASPRYLDLFLYI